MSERAGEPDPIAAGVEAHRAGRLDEAAAIYAGVLEDEPEHADALHLLGVVEAMRGRLGEARARIEQALALRPDHVCTHANLGNVLTELGAHDEALASYRRAAELAPTYAAAWAGVGNAQLALGRREEALAAFDALAGLEPTSSAAALGRTRALDELGRTQEALAAHEAAEAAGAASPDLYVHWGRLLARSGSEAEAQWRLFQALELRPEDPAAEHFLAGLRGRASGGAPRAYVEQLFDGCAAAYDGHMRGVLGYRAPEALCDLFASVDGDERRFERLLDLGCGTGFAGRLLARRAREAWGVDLSGRMLEQARATGAYAELRHAGVVEFLEATDATFDLFVAADVLVYLGELEPLFVGIARRALPEARLLLSHERRDEGTWRLEGTGRFAHSDAYVDAALERAGFAVLASAQELLRHEGGAPVVGRCLVAGPVPSPTTVAADEGAERGPVGPDA